MTLKIYLTPNMEKLTNLVETSCGNCLLKIWNNTY